MIYDIIKAINGKVKMCLMTANAEIYFVENITSFNDNTITFNDAVSKETVFLSEAEISKLGITTFEIDTIPSLPIIENIKDGDNSFFTENMGNHDASNKKFNELVYKCKVYNDYFDDGHVGIIKKYVIEHNTQNLERLKILGSKKVISFNSATTSQNLYISKLYWGLVDKKLLEAIAEIDSSIKDMDDEDFKADAEIIKLDLKKNVAQFKNYMQGVTFDKLFNQWPTLLNPSPFNIDE